MTIKQSLAVITLSAATTLGSIYGYNQYRQSHPLFSGVSTAANASMVKTAGFNSMDVSGPMVDFEKAANKAAPAVVHIRTLTKARQVNGRQNSQRNPFEELFGDQFGDMFRTPQQGMTPEQRASGSGVSISADGYIVTNNHVIDGADDLLVTLNNKKDYKAKVIGKDPSSDLAVLKIDATDLPYLSFANSDDLHLGQWVLAIGYPLNLETTVTSGIISAKSRSLGINNRQSKSPVEAFIQTDAAVNPGNSGGALVNTDGDVIGINSAIASPTGSYAGYSYAIPSNLVRKVVDDIIRFGSTKRAYLGVMYGSDQLSEEDRKQNNIKEGDGIYVMEVSKGSAAEEAGIQKGDFITKINGAPVSTGTQMVEKIAVMHPGDKISITYQHNGNEKTASAILKGDAGTYASIQQQEIEQLGATFENLDKAQAAKLNINGGIVVTSLSQGLIADQTRMQEGFIILKVNNTIVQNIDQLKAALANAGNSAIVKGIYPSQPQVEYQYALNDLNR